MNNTQKAKSLRKNQTEAESKLWHYLRNKQLHGFKFRRQQPLGNYIVDFVCFEKKLIIEVDGGQHAENGDADLRRTQWLNERGYRVIRFWNNEVLNHCSGVLDKIMGYCS